MQGGTPKPFGKRRAPVATARPAGRGAQDDPHRAFFQAMRAEAETGDPTQGAAREVPRSLRAAVLAGLVVACGLAGLDATQQLASLSGLTAAIPGRPELRMLGPAMILLSVIGGGRAAATSLLLAHGALSRLGQTGHLAYAAAGAAAAALLAAAILMLTGHAPAHGIPIDILAGAAGGFFYRVFAGTRSLGRVGTA